MHMLDPDNVKTMFMQLSGCEDTRLGQQEALINSAISSLEERLDREKAVGEEIQRCEYAAACCAVYDYVCKECAAERTVATPVGKAAVREDRNYRIDAARELKLMALEEIRALCSGTDFMFFTRGPER
ncbi:MAG: hypothetical protein IJ806_01695 [Ruminococcus sp.]|nr:hypothetical protein [Ruminococcus sp.]